MRKGYGLAVGAGTHCDGRARGGEGCRLRNGAKRRLGRQAIVRIRAAGKGAPDVVERIRRHHLSGVPEYQTRYPDAGGKRNGCGCALLHHEHGSREEEPPRDRRRVGRAHHGIQNERPGIHVHHRGGAIHRVREPYIPDHALERRAPLGMNRAADSRFCERAPGIDDEINHHNRYDAEERHIDDDFYDGKARYNPTERPGRFPCYRHSSFPRVRKVWGIG